MAKAKHYSVDGRLVGEVDLPDAAFGTVPNEHVVWEAVKTYQSNQRQGTSATKRRAEVSGGGRKPWRQKGTGRARAGSTRSPIWKGGGTVFGPQPRSYQVRLPKKTRRLALVSAMSQRAQEGNVAVVDEFNLDGPKTKTVAGFMKAAGLEGRKVCVIAGEADQALRKSFRNIPGVAVLSQAAMNVYDMINAEVLLFTTGAMEKVKEAYGS